jgi:anti-sigma regulatory factor (Ser/Thr protein kinase)
MGRNSESDMPPDEIAKPAVADAIPALVEFVSHHAWEAGFGDERVRNIGLATEEALRNILSFACPGGSGEISISCSVHDSGSLIIHIMDTGVPFNMLLAGTFPEIDNVAETEKAPSTRVMKRVIKNIEYIRGRDKNTLIFTISPLSKRAG